VIKTEKIEPVIPDVIPKPVEKQVTEEAKTSRADDTTADLIQDKIAELGKVALKPFYMNKYITKEEYKYILKKVVAKVRNG
jgi:hypothetical protein